MKAGLLLALSLASCGALTLHAPQPMTAMKGAPVAIFMQAGAPAIAKPKTVTRQKTSGGGPGGGGGGAGAVQTAQPKLKRIIEDIPMWKVVLLGDSEYEEDPVCKSSLV